MRTSSRRSMLVLMLAFAACLPGTGAMARQAGSATEPAAKKRANPQASTRSGRPKNATTTAKAKAPPKRAPDVIFVPTPIEVVEKMLELAEVKKGDVLYDLGCGNGIIIATAAKKYGIRTKGFDIDPIRVKETKERIEAEQVGRLASVEHADIFEQDLTPASVVTLYLLPALNVKLIPQLDQLRPGTRIVSHDFDMEGVKPEKEIDVDVPGDRTHKVYLWRTPLRKEQARR